MWLKRAALTVAVSCALRANTVVLTKTPSRHAATVLQGVSTLPTTRIALVSHRRVVRAKRGRTRMNLAMLRVEVAREAGTGNSMANRVLTALRLARFS